MKDAVNPTMIASRILRGQDPFRVSTTRVYAPLKVRRKKIRSERRKKG